MVLIRLLMPFCFLLLSSILVSFLVVFHVLRFVHRVSIGPVVIRRHAFIGLWQIFVVLGILVVYAFVGLLIGLRRHAFGWNMGYLHGRVGIRIGMHPWVHFPIRSLYSLVDSLSSDGFVVLS